MQTPAGISIVIPVYNERNTIEKILERVEAQEIVTEIVVVDDCSLDGTGSVLAKYVGRPRYRVAFHHRNLGKGAALRTGFARAGGDIIIVQDADLEYDPSDFGALVEPILSGRADVVYGSRFIHGPRGILDIWHYLGNRFLTGLSNLFTNLHLSDMEVCYKVFRASVLKELDFKCKRFGIEPEITAKIARMGIRIHEVPIRYDRRRFAEGKKIGWKDGIAAVWWIFRFGLFG